RDFHVTGVQTCALPILNYSAALIEGRTVRASARQCGIDKNTSFRWRHRFLTLPAAAKANHLEGVVEADETFFPVSCKGQRQLDQIGRASCRERVQSMMA